MKKLSKILPLLLLVVLMFSCTTEDTTDKLELSKIDLKDMDFKLDFKYDIGQQNKKELAILLSKWVDEIYSNTNIKSSKDQILVGAIFHIEKDKTKVTPITEDKLDKSKSNSLSAKTSCPEGYESLGKCFSSNCVKEKLAIALDPISNGTSDCVDVRVVRTTFYVLVCSKNC